MTSRNAGSFVTRLAFAAALTAAAGPAAAGSTPDLAESYAALSAQIAAPIARQKTAAAQAAPAPAVPELLARAKPDFSFTPGHLCTETDPNFLEYRYPEHVPYCRRNVTQDMKRTVGGHYGVPSTDWSGYEFDHLIPLALGGDSSIDNLWPQPRGQEDGSDAKDKLENDLYLQIKAGTVTQADAVRKIYAWFEAAQMADRALQAAR